MGASFTFDLPTPEIAAARLYATLHHCDESGLDLIVIVPPPSLPRWTAILDRLGRASVPFDSWPASRRRVVSVDPIPSRQSKSGRWS